MSTCSIEQVLAPNGAESKLYRDLHLLVGDPTRAMQLYVEARADEFASSDENGEPRLDDILESIPSITEAEVDNYYLYDTDALYDIGIVDTADLAFKGIVERIKRESARLHMKMGTTKTSDERAWYRDQINKLNSQRSRIEKNKEDLEIFESIAAQQLKWVEDLLDSRRPNTEQLMHASSIVKNWSAEVTSNFLSDDDKEVTDSIWNIAFGDIAKRAHALDNKLVQTLRKYVVRNAKRLGEPLEESDLHTVEEVSFITRTLFDLSKIDNKLSQHISGLITRAVKNQAKALTDISNKLNELADGVDMTKLIDDRNLITPEGSAYHNALREADRTLSKSLYAINLSEDDEATKNKSIQRAYKKHYTTRRAYQEVIDIRYFSKPGFKGTHGSLEKYVKDLKKRIPDTEYVDNLVDRAQDMWESYQSELKDFIQRLDDDIVAEYVPFTEREKHIIAWEKLNSPLVFQDEFNGETLNYGNTDGYRYAVTVPLGQVNTKDSFFSKQYFNLTDKERALLDYVNDLMRKFLAVLPENMTRDLGAGFFPVVQKSLLEYVMGDGSWARMDLKGGSEEARKQLLGHIVDENIAELYPQQEIAREATGVDGRREKKIPIRYIHDPIGPQRSGESDEAYKKRVEDGKKKQSFDIVNVMERFSKMAINYQFMNEIEDKILLAKRVVDEVQEIEKRGGSKLFTAANTLLKKKAGEGHFKKGVEYLIDAQLYGNKRLDNEMITSAVVYDPSPFTNAKKRRAALRIRKAADLLEEAHDMKEITTEHYTEQKEKLEREYKELNGRRFSAGKSIEAIMGFTQLKSMGWNIPAGFANLGFGALANVVHASAGVDFNGRELATATRIMLMARNKNPDKVKAVNFIRMLDVLFEVTEIGYGKSAERRKHKKIQWLTNPFETMRRTEFNLQGSSTVAQALHTKIKDKNGIERSLWDAFNVDMTWNVEEFGPQPAEWNPNNLSSDTSNEFTKFRDKVEQVNIMLHGNYSPSSPVEAKKWVVGRALMQYRSWMPEGFLWRFGTERYDSRLGRTIKGRYVSLRDIKREHGWGKVLGLTAKMLVRKNAFNSIDGKKLADIDIQNMRANIAEMRFYLGVSVAMLMLSSIELDDEDPEDQIIAGTIRMLLNQIHRIESDITYYISPGTMNELVKSPFPFMRTIEDFQNAIDATMKFTTDAEYKGQNPALKWSKTFPFTTQIYKLWYLSTHDINWDNY